MLLTVPVAVIAASVQSALLWASFQGPLEYLVVSYLLRFPRVPLSVSGGLSKKKNSHEDEPQDKEHYSRPVQAFHDFG